MRTMDIINHWVAGGEPALRQVFAGEGANPPGVLQSALDIIACEMTAGTTPSELAATYHCKTKDASLAVSMARDNQGNAPPASFMAQSLRARIGDDSDGWRWLERVGLEGAIELYNIHHPTYPLVLSDYTDTSYILRLIAWHSLGKIDQN